MRTLAVTIAAVPITRVGQPHVGKIAGFHVGKVGVQQGGQGQYQRQQPQPEQTEKGPQRIQGVQVGTVGDGVGPAPKQAGNAVNQCAGHQDQDQLYQSALVVEAVPDVAQVVNDGAEIEGVEI